MQKNFRIIENNGVADIDGVKKSNQCFMISLFDSIRTSNPVLRARINVGNIGDLYNHILGHIVSYNQFHHMRTFGNDDEIHDILMDAHNALLNETATQDEIYIHYICTVMNIKLIIHGATSQMIYNSDGLYVCQMQNTSMRYGGDGVHYNCVIA